MVLPSVYVELRLLFKHRRLKLILDSSNFFSQLHTSVFISRNLNLIQDRYLQSGLFITIVSSPENNNLLFNYSIWAFFNGSDTLVTELMCSCC